MFLKILCEIFFLRASFFFSKSEEVKKRAEKCSFIQQEKGEDVVLSGIIMSNKANA